MFFQLLKIQKSFRNAQTMVAFCLTNYRTLESPVTGCRYTWPCISAGTNSFFENLLYNYHPVLISIGRWISQRFFTTSAY